DEITSGNGYWFAIREKDLVERFLINNEKQSFNPISEAKTVLSIAKAAEPVAKASASEDEIAPLSAEDLEYPDFDFQAPPEQKVNVEVKAPERRESKNVAPPVLELEDPKLALEDEEVGVSPSAEDLEEPELPSAPRKAAAAVMEAPPVAAVIEPEEEEVEEVEEEVVVKKTKNNKKNKKAMKVYKSKNDRYLFVLLALVVILIGGIIYYYRSIINKPLPGFETSWLIDSANAQAPMITSSVKKKSMINITR